MHTQENWELGLYEVIDQIWDKTRNKVKKKVIEQKKEIGRKVTTQEKKINVFKKAKRLSNVENPDRIEDRIVKNHTKIRSHNESSTQKYQSINRYEEKWKANMWLLYAGGTE